jgi:GNAT superfamily N-acetyltransferase
MFCRVATFEVSGSAWIPRQVSGQNNVSPFDRIPMSMPVSQATIRIEPDAADSVRSVVVNGLREYNRLHAPAPGFQPLVVAARQGEQIIGGLVGETGWNWLHVELLWVAEAYRHRGIGFALLRAAEDEALRRGAGNVYLDTFEFQARSFYERHGYTVFGVQEDYPPGHTRFYMRRDLPIS